MSPRLHHLSSHYGLRVDATGCCAIGYVIWNVFGASLDSSVYLFSSVSRRYYATIRPPNSVGYITLFSYRPLQSSDGNLLWRHKNRNRNTSNLNFQYFLLNMLAEAQALRFFSLVQVSLFQVLQKLDIRLYNSDILASMRWLQYFWDFEIFSATFFVFSSWFF